MGLAVEAGRTVATPHKVPDEALGMGLCEASREPWGTGIIEHGRTKVLNAVVPTTWNAGPRDVNNVPGPMEQAIIGAPLADPANPIEVVRIIRSMDPCFGVPFML